jgi:hypothetical protein
MKESTEPTSFAKNQRPKSNHLPASASFCNFIFVRIIREVIAKKKKRSEVKDQG